MFQHAVIKLAGPICKCQQQDLAWGIAVVDRRPTIVISCNLCHQELKVAPAEFKAGFELEEKYPETTKAKKEIVKNGTVIDARNKFLK